MRRAVLALSLALALAAPAALAFRHPIDRAAQLDGDRPLEHIEVVRHHLPGVPAAFDQTLVRVRDTCPGGRVIGRRISGLDDNLFQLRVVRVADSHAGAEVFFAMFSGAGAHRGEARVVSWRPAPGPVCRAPRYLFRYSTDRPTRHPAGATRSVAGFDVAVRNLTRRFRGPEVKLVEGFLAKGDAQCCPTFVKTTLWRYSRARDRFVVYSSRVRIVPTIRG